MSSAAVRRLILFSLIPVSGLLAACTSVGEPRTSQFSPAEDCMFARSLRDWRPLDNENLILFGSGRVPYHVELVRPAFGLTFDVMIGVYDRDGRICPFGGDAIIVDGPMPERITIRSMERLDEDELDALYVRFGIQPPPVGEEEFEEIPVETDEQ